MRGLTGVLVDLEEEVLGVPEAVGGSAGGLDHVVGALELAGGQAEDDGVDDALEVPLDGVGEGERLGDAAAAGEAQPGLEALAQGQRVPGVRGCEGAPELVDEQVAPVQVAVLLQQPFEPQPAVLAPEPGVPRERAGEDPAPEQQVLPVGLPVPLQDGLRPGEDDEAAALVQPVAGLVAALQQLPLAAPAQPADHAVVAELDQVEEVVADPHVRAEGAERAVVGGVHVHGHRLHAGHPVLPHVADEPLHRAHVLALAAPQHVPALQVEEHRRVAVPPVQQELVHGKVPAAVRPLVLEAPLQPPLVDVLDDRRMHVVLPRHLLERVPARKVQPDQPLQAPGDPVPLRQEAGPLALHMPAAPAPAPGHPRLQQVDAPQHRHPLDVDGVPVVPVHPPPAFRADPRQRRVQHPLGHGHLFPAPARAQMRLDGHVEACQPEACHDNVAHGNVCLSLLV